MDDRELLSVGKDLLREEASCIVAAADRAGDELVRAAESVTKCGGRVVVSGLGKSGHVGRKIAATFASLGIPAFFLHAAEALHGDLGMVCREDVGVLLSNSGETAEVVSLVPHFKRIGATVISMTGSRTSTLARTSDIHLDTAVDREADPLGLAPTSSTSVQMAMGDAIAAISARMQGLKPEDFARVHPGGTLGKKLLLRVEDVMSSGTEMPTASTSALVRDALFAMTSKGFGATIVVADDGSLAGIFTDGDLRRLLERRGVGAMELSVVEGMTREPRTIAPDCLALEALGVMERLEISVLIAVEDRRAVGIVHLHELLKAGLR